VSRYTGATWRPIPENRTQPTIRATQVILHVSASESRSLFDWWNSPGNELESHFHVARDGYAEQYVDTARSADANYLANRRPDGTGAISIETQGADANGPWTAAQLDRLVAIIRWANTTHGVPLRLCRNANDPGIGWHVMWGSPGAWTPVSKVCPGPARVQQVKSVILPRLTGTSEEDELNQTQSDWLRDARNHANHADAVVSQNAQATREAVGRVEAKLDTMIAAMQDLTAAIRAQQTAGVPAPRTET
jgi:hypothetical protein